MRGGNAQECNVALGHRGGSTNDERQSSARESVGDQLLEAGFDDWDTARAKFGYLRLVDVGTHDGVAKMRETGAGGESDVAGADHCNSGHR